MGVSFRLLKGKSQGPRLGELQTPHGTVSTPVFMPVGTAASVKALTPLQVKDTGTQIVLANTYHLYMRPGSRIVRRLGGLHQFMCWPGPILTDSGGFQVFSLSSLRNITEQGVTFRSHIDGSSHFIGPEESMSIQHDLGADIIMCFDECIGYPASRDSARLAADRTARWARRCINAHEGHDQSLFGIAQGSVYEDERKRSAATIAEMGLAGYAIGGLSVGEPRAMMRAALQSAVAELPADKPRYLMGVGTPEDIIDSVMRGVDMFDCVMPTRIARHGAALTYKGRVMLKSASLAEDSRPIEEGCDCYTCSSFSRGYIRHLFKAQEPLALTLASVHNLRFMSRLMQDLRDAIRCDAFDDWVKGFGGFYGAMENKRNETTAVEEQSIDCREGGERY